MNLEECSVNYFRLYLIPMCNSVGFPGIPVYKITSLLSPDSISIFDHKLRVYSVATEDNRIPSLPNNRVVFFQLPPSSWLHLAKIDDAPVFVLSCPIDQYQAMFLTFSSTTRISELEEKLVLLKDALNNRTADQSADIALELTADDLKIRHAHLPDQDGFLSIFSDLEKSVAKISHKTLNEGDTQPISL